MKEFDNSTILLGFNLNTIREALLGRFARMVMLACDECRVPGRSDEEAYATAVVLAESYRICNPLKPADIEKFCITWAIEPLAILYAGRNFSAATLALQIKDNGRPLHPLHRESIAFGLQANPDSRWLNTSLTNYGPLGPIDPARLNKH